MIQKRIVIRGTLLNLYRAGAVNPRCRISRVATATGCHTYLNRLACLCHTMCHPWGYAADQVPGTCPRT